MTAQHTTIQRYLDAYELASMDEVLVYVAEYQGAIDEDGLRRAFELLCRQRPAMRSRVRRDERGHLLYVDPGHHPEFAVRPADESTYVTEAQAAWSSADSLSRLVLVPGSGGGFVTLLVDHTIADRRGGLALWAQLWRNYTDLLAGAGEDESCGALPASPHALLRERSNYRPSPPPPPDQAMSYAADSVGRPPAIRRRRRLTAADTTRLVETARAERTSVHGLIGAAILIAQRTLADPGEAPVGMACWSAVDLRARMSPPVEPGETTNMVCIHNAPLQVPVDTCLVTLGRQIRASLVDAIDNEKLQVDALTELPPLDTTLPEHLANAFVSNVAVVPTLAQPAGLRITDLRLLRFGPADFVPFYRVYTYDGRLNIDFSYSSETFSDDQVDDLVAQITAQLTSGVS